MLAVAVVSVIGFGAAGCSGSGSSLNLGISHPSQSATATPPAQTPQSPVTAPSTAPSAAPSVPPVVAPAAGTQLLATQLDGAVNVIASFNGPGFTVVQDLTESNDDTGQVGVVTAYDAAGNAVGSISSGIDNACGIADIVLPSGRRVLLALSTTREPAQGVNPKTVSVALLEFDAATGNQLWSFDLIPTETDDGWWTGCNSSETGGRLIDFSPTVNGAYAVDSLPPDGGNWVIDLTAGTGRRSKTAIGTVGNVVIDGKFDPQTNEDLGDTYSDPATGTRLGKPSGIGTGAPDAGTYFADGSTYILAQVPQSGGYQVRALNLPSGSLKWAATQSSVEYDDVTVVGSTVIAWSGSGGAVAGFAQADGKKLWSVGSSEYCGSGDGSVLISVNDQLAVLDAATGHQTSYDPSTSDCPNMLPNGVTWSYDGSGNLTVEQYL